MAAPLAYITSRGFIGIASEATAGTPLAATSWVQLLSESLERTPGIVLEKLLRASRDFVQFAESQYPRLEAIVHRDYDAATRWLRWLGFRLEPLPDLGGDFCRARIGF